MEDTSKEPTVPNGWDIGDKEPCQSTRQVCPASHGGKTIGIGVQHHREEP